MINDILKQSCMMSHGLNFISLFYFPHQSSDKYLKDQELFRNDGVHLNPKGQRRVYKKFRSLVIKLANKQ